MQASSRLFSFECQGDTVIVVPVGDLGEFNFERMEAEAKEAFHHLEHSADKIHIVVDFTNTSYFGSTALGLFLKLWRRVRLRRGHMAFCGLSERESEILRLTKLDTLWSICETREEALEAVRRAV